MAYSALIVIASFVSCVLCQPQVIDPLCRNKVCPGNQVCRIIKPCGQTEQCNITAICTDTVATRGGCMIGDPILIENNGAQEDLSCYTAAPCPSNAYCSTLLQDVSSVCCRSNPVQTTRPGTCQTFTRDPNAFFCVDQCKTDSDCYYDEKCCHTGCMMECTPPQPPQPPMPSIPPVPQDPCDTKMCPTATYCRRLGAPCRKPWNCRPEGECIPCESVIPLHPRLGFRLERDPDGCPVLIRSRPPTRTQNDPMTLFLMWLYQNN